MKRIISIVLITFFSVGSIATVFADSINYNYSSNQNSAANSNINSAFQYTGNGWGSWDNHHGGYNGWGWGGWSYPVNNWNYYTTDTAPTTCKTWYDGCNTCSRQYPGGPLVCTTLACFAHNQPYCKEYFQTTTSWNPWGWNSWGYPWHW